MVPILSRERMEDVFCHFGQIYWWFAFLYTWDLKEFVFELKEDSLFKIETPILFNKEQISFSAQYPLSGILI